MRLRFERYASHLFSLCLAAAPLFAQPAGAQPAAARPGPGNGAGTNGHSIVPRTPVGSVSVQVSRITKRMTLDGTLSEPVYGGMPTCPGFVHLEPTKGANATEKTEA